MTDERKIASDIENRLLSHRCVTLGHIDGPVNETMLELMRFQLEDPKRPAYMLIDSSGGERHFAMELHDFIAYVLTIPVHALVVGQCASAATFVLLACEKRMCTPHARLKIHHGGYTDVSFKADNMSERRAQELFAQAQKSKDEVVQLYAKKLGKSLREITKLMEQGDREFDNELDAKAALALRLVTHIITKAGVHFPPFKEKAK